MTEKFDAARRESAPMGMEPDGPYQAEPFKETLEAFRLRVITKGGNVEEHYAVRRIDQLEAEVERLREIINSRATMLIDAVNALNQQDLEDAVKVTVDMIPSLGFVVYGPGEWRYHKNSRIYLCVWADTLQFGITNCWHVRNPTRGHIRRLLTALEGG